MQSPQRFDVGIKALMVGPLGALIAQQSETSKWEFVGGRINVGEEFDDPRDILKREIKEELGADLQYSIEQLFTTGTRFWDAGPRKGDFVFLVTYLCRYQGGRIELSDEHTAYAWVTKESVREFDLFPDYARMLKEYWDQV